MIDIVFICGALRSGSSLTHLMLDHHPSIKNPGEFDFLFEKVSDDGIFPEISSYHNWLSLHRIFQSKSLQVDRSLNYQELIHSFIKQLSVDGSVLALNIHRSFHRIPFLFPDAKYIHLIRDPRDVARSSIGMGWAGNVYYGVDHWVATERDWILLEKKVLPEQFLQIKFETLIVIPEQVLGRVCEFVGLEYSERMMDYTLKSTYSNPDASLVNQWKRKLSVREAQYVELKASPLMSALGYELSGAQLISIGLFAKSKLKMTNKLHKVNFTIKRYGFFLWSKERFSRLFNLKTMHKQVVGEKNKITQSFLK